MSDGIIVAIGGWGATVVAAVVAAWAALRARRKLDGDVSIFDVWVCEGADLLAEPETDVQLLNAIVPDRPLLDIAVRNDGDRKGLVRRLKVELKGALYVPPIDSPSVVRMPVPVSEPGVMSERRIGPSGSYAINFPLLEGSYGKTVNLEIDPGDVDRFALSLVAKDAARGREFYQVRLFLEGGKGRKVGRQTMSEPMMVPAYGPPSWESPAEIKEYISQIANRVRELAPQGLAEVAVIFNGSFYPHAIGMEEYVSFYENKLKVLATALRACLKHSAHEDRIRGWIDEVERDLTETEQLRRHAADLRATGRHP
ncbi:hypothetical protein GCM10010095_09740 [Streptomyces anthocyanicus]|uniref:hypothetical protein n=1 Tax=Streptomyces anthocyanicus TaxID=68174 RepID=UPI00167146AD|nr:hypothetical protein [Streptomyces anthocyanicus]GGL26729.1 hypothetical protein GCM10010095_09740 [Streptomyces anthocyanicus]